MKRKNEEITFKDILAIFLPKFWLIAIAAIVCSALLGFRAYNTADTYTSSTLIDIRKNSDAIQITDVDISNYVIVKFYEKVRSDDFLAEICNHLVDQYESETRYRNLTPAHIRASLTYQTYEYGQLKLSITTTNGLDSLRIAQAFEAIIIPEIIEYSKDNLKPQVFSPAKISYTPNDKGVVKQALIGFVAGGVASTIAVWAFAVLDVTVRNKKKLESSFTYPILGAIPTSNKNKGEA